MFDEMSSVIRHFLAHRHSSYVDPPIAPKRVSMVAMKIRYLIEQLVPVEVKVISLPRRDLDFSQIGSRSRILGWSRNEFYGWYGKQEGTIVLVLSMRF